MFSLINSSLKKIFLKIQEFSRTPEKIQGQQDVFQESRTKRVLIANSRTRTSGNLSCAICAHAHRWDTCIFLFYFFADIVDKVSALINCQPSLII